MPSLSAGLVDLLLHFAQRAQDLVEARDLPDL